MKILGINKVRFYYLIRELLSGCCLLHQIWKMPRCARLDDQWIRTEEISRFARDDEIISLFGVSWEGVSPSQCWRFLTSFGKTDWGRILKGSCLPPKNWRCLDHCYRTSKYSCENNDLYSFSINFFKRLLNSVLTISSSMVKILPSNITISPFMMTVSTSVGYIE